MKCRHVKTLEEKIIFNLKNTACPNSAKARDVLKILLNFFTDMDFLYDTKHVEIISLIYFGDFYKHNLANALPQKLFIDNKTLLSYRKIYLKLFAKHFLDLKSPSDKDLDRLFDILDRTEKK